MPVYVHLIEHPQGRVLVDTGFTELHPAVDDMEPRIFPLDTLDLDLASVDMVVNTHLHFDHLGGNHLFPGVPIYVQRQELEDARGPEEYTIPEWVDPPGVEYVPVDGELELLPGVRLLPAPGHTRGSQIVVIEADGGPVVIAGDTAVFFGELDEPTTEGPTADPFAQSERGVALAHARAVATEHGLESQRAKLREDRVALRTRRHSSSKPRRGEHSIPLPRRPHQPGHQLLCSPMYADRASPATTLPRPGELNFSWPTTRRVRATSASGGAADAFIQSMITGPFGPCSTFAS